MDDDQLHALRLYAAGEIGLAEACWRSGLTWYHEVIDAMIDARICSGPGVPALVVEALRSR